MIPSPVNLHHLERSSKWWRLTGLGITVLILAPEDTLGVADYWNSDYSFAMQDCHVYDFSAQYPGDPMKILAVKETGSLPPGL